MAKTLHVVAHIRARKETQEELRKVLEGLIAPTRKESGCLRYELFRNNLDPQDLTFIEQWEGDAALDAQLRSPHFLSAQAAFPRLVDGSPIVGRYTLIA